MIYESTFTLAMANSGINPAIYAWKNKGFRRAFLRLLRCKNPNLSENHFSYNYTRKTSKPVETPNNVVNGICNGTEQYVLESELGAEKKRKGSNNNDSKEEDNMEKKEQCSNSNEMKQDSNNIDNTPVD